jgi:hypothetical protein
MPHVRWRWLVSAALSAVLCCASTFVLVVALPFDEVDAGPRPGTRLLVATITALTGVAAALMARRGVRAKGP